MGRVAREGETVALVQDDVLLADPEVQGADNENSSFLAAVRTRAFYDCHVCRVTPWPPEVARTFAAVDADPTVYHTMNGPNEFHVIGTMKGWSIIDRLHLIQVPTLVFRGAYDEATPACVQPFLDNIPDVESLVFPNSSHLPHVEEKDDCLAAVERFLAKHDA